MNRMGGGPNMTFLIIGLFAFVAMIALGILANQQFVTDNTIINQSNSDIQSQALANLSAQQSVLEAQTSSVTGGGFIQGVFGLGSVIFTTGLIGIQALLTLVTLPATINNIFNTLGEGLGFGGPAILIIKTFLVSIVAVYVTMKIMQAVRGTNDSA